MPRRKPARYHTPSGRALAGLAESAKQRGSAASVLMARLRAEISYTQMIRYIQGTGLPDAITVGKIHRITGGIVAAHQWMPDQPDT